MNDKKTASASLLLGLAVGDALGVPVEFKPRGSFRVTGMQGCGTHNQPPGTWSDDTSLALCLADSLSRGFDTADIARNFVRWRDEGAFTARGDVFDIGISTSKAINRLKSGITPEKAGCSGVAEVKKSPQPLRIVQCNYNQHFTISRKNSAKSRF
ncbi:MAG: hypothetical protein Pg6C_11010 [Treponemataceae bacterium]|nr:MAG: hypothetical protein Pg6C_11010 [Treponemataceae bacterium]